MHDHHGHGDHDGDTILMPSHQHALVIVGTQQLFLVHMTNMWTGCHQYQAIFRIHVPADVKSEYLKDRNRHRTDWYIIGNTKDDLMSLPEIKRGKRTSFTGSIWRGLPSSEGTESWPWANEKPVIESFKVTIDQVVYFRHFDFNLNYPNTLTYILFGAGDEAHLNHYQVKQPEFDHVVTLTEAPSWLPQTGLEAGMPINFPDIPASPGGRQLGQSVYCSNPLTRGTHHVQFAGYGPGRAITIDRSIWFGTWPVNEEDPCA